MGVRLLEPEDHKKKRGKFQVSQLEISLNYCRDWTPTVQHVLNYVRREMGHLDQDPISEDKMSNLGKTQSNLTLA